MAAAAEMPVVPLEDAFRVALVLLRAGDRRAQAATLRWFARFCMEVRPDADEAQLVLAALRALDGPSQAAAGEALLAVFEQRGLRTAGRALEEWLPT